MKEKRFCSFMTTLDESLYEMNMRIGGRILSDGRKIISVFTDPEHNYHAISQTYQHVDLKTVPDGSPKQELQDIINSYETTNNLTTISAKQWSTIKNQLGIEDKVEEATQPYEQKENIVQRISHSAKKIKEHIFGKVKQRKRKKLFHGIVDCYNSSRSYHRIAETFNLESHMEAEELLREALEQYQPGKNSFQITAYNHHIASDHMKQDIVDSYCTSKESLKSLAKTISEKYGMNISSSTISKYARKETKTKNRKEARKLAKKS